MKLQGSLAGFLKEKAMFDLDEDAVIDYALFQCHESLSLIAREFGNKKAQTLAEEIITIRKAGDLLQESDSDVIDVDEGNDLETLWKDLTFKISQVDDFIDLPKKERKDHAEKLWVKWQEFCRCLKSKGLLPGQE